MLPCKGMVFHASQLLKTIEGQFDSHKTGVEFKFEVH